MKRLFAFILCLCTLLGVFTACGKKDRTAAGGIGADGKLTITIGLPVNMKVEDYDTNAYTLWLEETTGYNLEFVTFAASSADYKSQIATRLDDLPNILWGVALGSDVYQTYGEDGYFLDLAEYFENEELAGDFWAQLDKMPEEVREYALNHMYDKSTGAIYGVPCIEYSAVDTIDYMPFINQTWLDNLGLPMPTNTKELYDVLVAFKTKDANGNGDPNDEVPIMGFEKAFCGDVINWIVNMYIYADDSIWWNVDENGKLYSPYTTDKYREALQFIYKLNKEGLLPGETTYSGSHSDIKSVLSSGASDTVGIWLGHPTSTLPNDCEAAYNYKAMPIWGNAVRKQNAFSVRTFITDSCQYPEDAFKLLMLMCSEEGGLRMRYGQKGVDWEVADEGGKSYLEMDASIKILNEGAFNAIGNQTWGAMNCTILHASENEASQMDENTDQWTRYKLAMLKECNDNYTEGQKNNPDTLVPVLVFSTEQSKSISAQRDNCTAYIKECRSHFGAGLKDPNNDAEWNKYLEELKKMGIEDWKALSQEVYDAQTAG